MLWEYAHHDKPLYVEDAALDSCGMPEFYDNHVIPNIDPLYAEMTMRAMSLCVPKLDQYVGMIGGKDVYTDGGYYTYAPDRMPVIGGVKSVPGYYMANGVAGYGIMAAMGVAEAIADEIEGKPLRSPEYAQFDPNRLYDIELRRELERKILLGGDHVNKAVGGSI